MSRSDDENFRARPGPPRARGGARPKAFVAQVLKAASASGAKPRRTAGGRPASRFGRGRVAAGAAGRRLPANTRRVVVKSRYVMLRRAGKAGVRAHLRYIERDGVRLDGSAGKAYGADTDAADLEAFEERGRGDRHQFRFIVSPEDAAELEDLPGFTRRLMQQMAIDLETPLDWVAVDHWDTDNPHTHVVLRGRVGSGRDARDLVIAPDYIAHGIRLRASEIATEWLGPRTEREIQQGWQREVGQERLTGLDRELVQRGGTTGIVTLQAASGEARSVLRESLLRSRLQRLQAVGLAHRTGPQRWQLDAGLQDALATMGRRGDIVRTLHRAMAGEPRELVTDPAPGAPVVGRLQAKGLDDELLERPYLVIDGLDGRAHYVTLPVGSDLSALPVGGIVACGPPQLGRNADRLIRAASTDGLYEEAMHRASLTASGHAEPDQVVQACRRRLEALRRGGVVARVGEGVWQVPEDLVERARAHDAARTAARVVELRSALTIEQQVGAEGATWLDRQLAGTASPQTPPAPAGFGAQVRQAQDARLRVLEARGLVVRQGQRWVLARDLLQTLTAREVQRFGEELAARAGRLWRPVKDGERVRGVYRDAVQLTSGRFALLDDGKALRLVPWQPVIEARRGQELSVVLRGTSANWEVGRARGIGR